MTNRLQNNNWIALEQLNQTLALNGKALLSKVVNELNLQSSSVFSVIVEWHSRQAHIDVVAIATDDLKAKTVLSLSSDHREFFHDIAIACAQHFYRHYSERSNSHDLLHSTESLVAQHALWRGEECYAVRYVAVPLTSGSGELSGVLLSGTLEHEQPSQAGLQTLSQSGSRDASKHDSPQEAQPISKQNWQENTEYHHFYANIVKHSLREKWSSDRSEALVHQLSHQVSHDSLTDLFNRACLSDTLETLTHSSTCFSLCYLDIDNFKLINDINGSYLGDLILRFTADTLRQQLPKSTMSFRVAGDEFVFIAFDNDPWKLAESVLDVLERGYQDPSNHIYFSVSMGIVPRAKHHLSSDELIHNADLALKECKKHADKRIQYFDHQLSARYQRKTQLIEALRTQLQLSVEHSEIFVALQPIVHVGQEHWHHFEVLARWSSVKYGSVAPLEFIQVAEQSGLIVPLGDRIIELACLAKRTLETELGYRVTLSINCSALELSDAPRYINNLNMMMVRYNHLPEDFVIELTESVLLPHSNQGGQVLESLRYLGFKVALDDFGTGYSSLNYIQSYPIDTIKIDSSFIRNMLAQETSERVVALIVQLAQQLKVDLVAEGVEDKRALSKLLAMGCHQIQGYYFSRPHKPLEMIAIIKNQTARQA